MYNCTCVEDELASKQKTKKTVGKFYPTKDVIHECSSRIKKRGLVY